MLRNLLWRQTRLLYGLRTTLSEETEHVEWQQWTLHWRQSRHFQWALRQGTQNKHASPTGSSTEIGNVLWKSLYSLQVTYNKKSEISFVRTNKRHDLQSITWPHENGASGLSHNFQLGGGTKCLTKHVQCGRWHSQKERQAPYGSKKKKKDLGHWSEQNV